MDVHKMSGKLYTRCKTECH